MLGSSGLLGRLEAVGYRVDYGEALFFGAPRRMIRCMVVFGATGDLVAYLTLPPRLFPATVESLAEAG